jgi:hypothetical protein
MRASALALIGLVAATAWAQQPGSPAESAPPTAQELATLLNLSDYSRGTYIQATGGRIYQLPRPTVTFFPLEGARSPKTRVLVDFGGPACVWRVGIEKRVISGCISVTRTTLKIGSMRLQQSVLEHPSGAPASAQVFELPGKPEELRALSFTGADGQRHLPVNIEMYFTLTGQPEEVFVFPAGPLSAPLGIR